MLNIFFSHENRVVYEIMWKIIVEPYRPQVTIQRCTENVLFACQVTKAIMNINTLNISYLLLHN